MKTVMKGLGQREDSPITKSAAWLATATTLLAADPVYGRHVRDPFVHLLAQAMSPEAQKLFAELADPAAGRAFLAEYEAERPGSVGVVYYRKPWFEARTAVALEAGARQLVILGAGCDTLALRLAAQGLRPDVYELDRPEVTAFRERVLAAAPIDLSGVRRLGVDFDVTDFRDVLIERGFRRGEPSVFVSEGVMEYLDPRDVDVIFDFVRDAAGPRSTMIFSFTESTSGKRYTVPHEVQTMRGEPRRFELEPDAAAEFLAPRGFALQELWTASEIRDGLMRQANAEIGEPKLGVVPFMHFAVARVPG